MSTPMRRFRYPDDRWVRVQREAAARGLDASKVIRALLDSWLEEAEAVEN